MSRLFTPRSYYNLLARPATSTLIGVTRPAQSATRPIVPARTPTARSQSVSDNSFFSRDYNVNGNEVKVGSTIKWEDRTWLVLGTSVNMKGRAHTTYNIDLKDVNSSSKISIKVRPADKIEVIEMQTVRMNYLYRQGNTLYFMDPTSFEQVELDASLAPEKSASYLIEGSSTVLTRDGDTFVKISVPEKAICTVAETASARSNTVNDGAGKDAKLTNGITLSVPQYIEPGQHIVVSTLTNTFVSKSDTPPEPILEKTFGA